ncbi:MAG: hypothetical protein ABI759_13820 [Candidatus Solibacter sp.]
MDRRLLITGLVAACTLLAQPQGGPRGRGPMGMGMGPGPGGRGGFGGPGGPAAVVTGAPYSGLEVRTSQQVLAAGGIISRSEQTTVYRDTQGRVRRESTRKTPDGQTETRITISDPVAGVVHVLNATNKTAVTRKARFPNASQSSTTSPSTTGRGQMMAAGRRNAQNAQTATNTKRETLATRSMNGMLASGTRITRTIPAGSIGNTQALETVRESWIADDLKVPLMTRTSDPRAGTSTLELQNVNRSQPDPSLFTVPSDYTVKQGPGGFGGGRGPMGRGPRPARQQ